MQHIDSYDYILNILRACAITSKYHEHLLPLHVLKYDEKQNFRYRKRIFELLKFLEVS